MNIIVKQFGVKTEYKVTQKHGLYIAYYKGRMITFNRNYAELLDFLRG